MWLSKVQPHILQSRLVAGNHFLFKSAEGVSVSGEISSDELKKSYQFCLKFKKLSSILTEQSP
jgi:hypothetical protein